MPINAGDRTTEALALEMMPQRGSKRSEGRFEKKIQYGIRAVFCKEVKILELAYCLMSICL